MTDFDENTTDMHIKFMSHSKMENTYFVQYNYPLQYDITNLNTKWILSRKWAVNIKELYSYLWKLK